MIGNNYHNRLIRRWGYASLADSGGMGTISKGLAVIAFAVILPIQSLELEKNHRLRTLCGVNWQAMDNFIEPRGLRCPWV
jgi:hypothetical protein